jgi:DNA polymerase-3 subunit epsilon
MNTEPRALPAFLIVDTETTGVDPAKDAMIEVAGVLYDPNTASIIECYSGLTSAGENPAEPINGIPASVLQKPWASPDRDDVLGPLGDVLERGRMSLGEVLILAHSADFDRAFMGDEWCAGARWVCTFADAEWPRHHRLTGSVTNLCLAYGLGVARAHRAIEDCLMLAALLTRVHEVEGGLGAWLARAVEPRRVITARVDFKDNHLAKERAFRWNPDAKRWQRRVRVSQLEQFTAELPFRFTVSEAA